MGTLRQTKPISAHWGFDRGMPIDRYYIEQFLEEHRGDIRGRVLEIMDTRYSERFGTAVECVDVLDIDPSNPKATIIADLTDALSVPSLRFDCFLLIQTLQYIYPVSAAIAHAHRILKPGGVLLITVPAVSKIYDRYPDYWRFTAASCSLLLKEQFGGDQVSVHSYGNVLAALAFLTGMATEDLCSQELQANDEVFPIIITARAVKN
jgi:SAM-dependent methyltransferase